MVAALQSGEVQAIGHCANCFCTMRSGVAWQIVNAYPVAREEDLKTKMGDVNKLGTYSVAKMGEQHIFNIYGQHRFGYTGAQFVDYDALRKGLERVRNHMIITNIRSIGFPYKMGCDRAGGKWEIVKKIIQEVFEHAPLLVVIFKLDLGKQLTQ